MIGATASGAKCVQYELEIEINAPCERVWKAIVEETNLWWLPDFHMVAPDSIVTFDTSPGGRGLVETLENGGGLLWYSVQFCLPDQFMIYLVGHIAPDWGGPSTSNLKLAVEASDSGSVLRVTDAQHGNVDETSIESLSSGWKQLFTDGLREFVEKGTRRD